MVILHAAILSVLSVCIRVVIVSVPVGSCNGGRRSTVGVRKRCRHVRRTAPVTGIGCSVRAGVTHPSIRAAGVRCVGGPLVAGLDRQLALVASFGRLQRRNTCGLPVFDGPTMLSVSVLECDLQHRAVDRCSVLISC